MVQTLKVMRESQRSGKGGEKKTRERSVLDGGDLLFICPIAVSLIFRLAQLSLILKPCKALFRNEIASFSLGL